LGVHDLNSVVPICDAFGIRRHGGPHERGKTLFAQVMELVPWKTLGRIIERHKGDAGVRTVGCADLFRIMAFSQLTWRESLNLRDWRIYRALAMRLIAHARKLCAQDASVLNFDASVFVLDSTTIV
jgi:hypothetical protein